MFERKTSLTFVYQVEHLLCLLNNLGKYRIGKYLPSQARLGEKFKVSRITI